MTEQSENKIETGVQNKEEPPDQNYPGSVLLADRIEKFVKAGWLIVPDKTGKKTFDKHQLKRAKYDLRLGKKYYKGGGFKDLDEESDPFLVVEPYELVFVESYEVFKMPKNVVARYDLRVRSCVEGAGLQTGLQVDPTYYGRIFCPLFNFSDEKVTLKYKEHLASIQFLYTTPSTLEAEKYPAFDEERRDKFCLTQVLKSPRRSGLEELRTSIKNTENILEGELVEFRDKANRLHTRVDSMVGAVFEAMAIMIAALGVIAAAISIAVTSDFTIDRPAYTVMGVIVFLAVAVGIYYRVKRKVNKISGDKKTSSKQTKE